MWRYTLLGKHRNRTPLSYPAYQLNMGPQGLGIAQQVSLNQGPDALIFGYKKNFDEEIENILYAKKIRPSVKIFVLSEEPFWDSVWDKNFCKKNNFHTINNIGFEYHTLNHTTTSIYNFTHIPYFITTNDAFLARYRMLFSRNANLSKERLTEHWKNPAYTAAFFAEKRLNEKFSVEYPEQDIYGLCRYRSILTRDHQGPGTLRVGRGWKSGSLRQNVPDWHLDKITQLDEQVKFVSALENTHQPNYITEKIFDAYAVRGIPLYYANKNHKVFNIVEESSFINLYDLSTDDAIEKLNGFRATEGFIDQYMHAQKSLNSLFSDSASVRMERDRVCQEIHNEITPILKDS